MASQQSSPTAPINITGSTHKRRHSSSIGSLSKLPVLSASWGSLMGMSVQEDGSNPPQGAAGKMNINSMTERALSPPGTGGLFTGGNKTIASAYVTRSDPHPVNRALNAVTASQKRPASPMGSAILKGQFLD